MTPAERQAKSFSKLKLCENLTRNLLRGSTMFDIKEVEKQAKAELAEEQGKAAKAKIKEKLSQINKARAVVSNLEHEYEVLLREIGSDIE